jgi:pimeloyl-ACP methyl ester carboxylesterase
VHDLDGMGPAILLSHATGFHGHCYAPLAAELADRFHSFAIDYRGHGATAAPGDWDVRWEGYGDDALAVARALAPSGGLIGFGHSMGGTALLMAAHRQPGLFDVVIAFEPISFPGREPGDVRPPSPLVSGARRRRRTFASRDEAYENYASKPPLDSFVPAALRAYVDHGFVDTDDGVALACDPEIEARTFEMGGEQRSWDLLPEIATRVVVVAGKVEDFGPSSVAAEIAERLPNGTYVECPELDHFGPMTDPADMARVIADATWPATD